MRQIRIIGAADRKRGGKRTGLDDSGSGSRRTGDAISLAPRKASGTE